MAVSAPIAPTPAPADSGDTLEELPIPPIPPDQPPARQAAPLPDFNVSAPVATARRTGPDLRPDLLRPHSYNRGDGYLSGSGNYDEQRASQRPSAGLRLDVPIQ